MKQIQILITLLLLSLNLSAGGNGKYQKAMGETLAGYGSAQSPEDFQELANRFLRIAKAEEGEWLPRYYHAHCLIIESFMLLDPEKRDAVLDEAEISLEKVLEMVPKEAEAYALQGFYYTARLTVDPGSRGMQYSMLSNQSIAIALNHDPQNPRARYLKIANDMGAASFFGKSAQEYCPAAQELYEQWDAYQAPSPIHPTWGKEQLADLMKDCK